MIDREYPGKYIDDETLDRLISGWGHDLSFRAEMSVRNLSDPHEDRMKNRQRMVDAASVYVGLRMLKYERQRHETTGR